MKRTHHLSDAHKPVNYTQWIRYDESEHGANADHAPEEQDYVDLKDLLKELDDVVVDTSVTCSEIQYWKVCSRCCTSSNTTASLRCNAHHNFTSSTAATSAVTQCWMIFLLVALLHLTDRCYILRSHAHHVMLLSLLLV